MDFRISLFLAFVSPSLLGQTGDALRVRTVSSAGMVLRTGASGSVSFQVVEGTRPVEGVDLILTAPTAGASLRFLNSTSPSGTLLRAVTDSSGNVHAQFTVNETPGWFRVDATVGTSGGENASVAFSVFEKDPPQTGTSPADVRTQAEKALGETPAQHLLHGPWLVPAGTILDEAVPMVRAGNGIPRVLASAAWVLWRETNFRLSFAKPVRLLVAPASEGAEAAVQRRLEFDINFWPRLRGTTEERFHSLGSPAADHRELAGEIEFPEIGQPEGPVLLRGVRRNDASQDACALFIYGSDLKGGLQTMGIMAEYLLTNQLVAPQNMFIYSRPRADGMGSDYLPPDAQQIRRLIRAAAERGCKKVYLIIHNHGIAEKQNEFPSIIIGRDPEKDNESDTNREGRTVVGARRLEWSRLAAWLKEIEGAEFVTLASVCYSGHAAQAFREAGLNGVVIADADTQRESVSTSEGSAFVAALISYLRHNPTVSLEEAARLLAADPKLATDTLRQHGFPKPGGGFVPYNPSLDFTDLFPAGPRVDTIGQVTKRTVHAPPVSMRQPGPSSPTFIITPDSPEGLKLDVKVTDSAIGKPATVQVAPSATPTPASVIQFLANQYGSTSYTLEGRDAAGREWSGTGRITVGRLFNLGQRHARIKVGESIDVAVGTERETTVAATSSSPTIAGVTVLRSSPISPRLRISGLSPGFTTVSVGVYDSRIDDFENQFISVEVIPVIQKQSACDGEFSGNATWTVRSGGIHTPFVQMPANTQLKLIVAGTTAEISGNIAQVVSARGTFNCATGTATLTGTSTAPIAGRSNVPAVYRISAFNVSSAGGVDQARFMAEYTLGTGVFPQEPYVVTSQVSLPGQPQCAYYVSRERFDTNSNESLQLVRVVTQENCRWTPQPSASWLVITGAPVSASGPGEFIFSIQTNSGPARAATISVGGRTVSVNQRATPADRPEIESVSSVGSGQHGFSSGSLINIGGKNLAQTTREVADSGATGGALPVNLDGVSVTVDGKPASIRSISPSNVTAVVPDLIPAGQISVSVNSSRGASDPFSVNADKVFPSTFQYLTGAAAFHAEAARADGSPIAPPGSLPGRASEDATPGETVSFLGTGFGDTIPRTGAAQLLTSPAALASGVVARIGGVDAVVKSATKIAPGRYRFDIEIPPLPDGSHEMLLYVDGIPTQSTLVPIKNR